VSKSWQEEESIYVRGELFFGDDNAVVNASVISLCNFFKWSVAVHPQTRNLNSSGNGINKRILVFEGSEANRFSFLLHLHGDFMRISKCYYPIGKKNVFKALNNRQRTWSQVSYTQLN